MTPQETRELYARAIERYGAGAQVMKAIEEFAELTQALCKACASAPERPAEGRGRGAEEKMAEICDNLAEEMADVCIMWQQLMLIFGNAREVDDWMERKKIRLLARLEEGDG